MSKLVAATALLAAPVFAARTGLPGSRHFLEDPDKADGSKTAPAVHVNGFTSQQRDELSTMMATALGPVGKQLAEVRDANIAAIKEVDSKMAALGTSGTKGAARSRWFAGLHSGNAPTKRAEETVEDRIERAREEAGYLRDGVGAFRHLPAGTAGIRDPRGLLAMRIMRAVALCTTQGKEVSVDLALANAARFFGSNDDATGYLEEARDLMAKYGSADEKERALAERALGTAVLGAGAAFVAPPLWGTFYDFLFPKSVLHRLGAGQLPLTSGLLLTYFDQAFTASYVGVNAGVNESSPVDNQAQIAPKTLQGVAALANDLLESASYAVDAILRLHMARAIAATSDLKGIQGLGTSFEPHGLDFWVQQPTTAHTFNRTLSGGVPTYDTVVKDHFNAIQKITDDNMEMAISPNTDDDGGVMPGVIYNNKDALGLMRIKVGTAERWPFQEEMRGGTSLGMKWAATTQTTKTDAGDGAGAGTNNKAFVYIGDFAQLKEAVKDTLKIETFRGGAYKNASGTVVSGITNRETVFEAHLEHEWVEVQRGKGLARIGSVDWAAQF